MELIYIENISDLMDMKMLLSTEIDKDEAYWEQRV